jgi:hypothetical protein
MLFNPRRPVVINNSAHYGEKLIWMVRVLLNVFWEFSQQLFSLFNVGTTNLVNERLNLPDPSFFLFLVQTIKLLPEAVE